MKLNYYIQFTKLYLDWWMNILLAAIFDLTAAKRLDIWGEITLKFCS